MLVCVFVYVLLSVCSYFLLSVTSSAFPSTRCRCVYFPFAYPSNIPEKVSFSAQNFMAESLSVCLSLLYNCHNFIFSLSFCGILAFTLSCPSPLSLLTSSYSSTFAILKQVFNSLAHILAELNFLLCYLIRYVCLICFLLLSLQVYL